MPSLRFLKQSSNLRSQIFKINPSSLILKINPTSQILKFIPESQILKDQSQISIPDPRNPGILRDSGDSEIDGLPLILPQYETYCLIRKVKFIKCDR